MRCGSHAGARDGGGGVVAAAGRASAADSTIDAAPGAASAPNANVSCKVEADPAAPLARPATDLAAVFAGAVARSAAAAGVAATGAIILATGGWYWLDPAVALAIAVVVSYHAFALTRKAVTRLRPAAAESVG